MKRFLADTYPTVDVGATAMIEVLLDEQSRQETLDEVAVGTTMTMIAMMTNRRVAEKVAVMIKDVRAPLRSQLPIC